jgi:hypothetical protein
MAAMINWTARPLQFFFSWTEITSFDIADLGRSNWRLNRVAWQVWCYWHVHQGILHYLIPTVAISIQPVLQTGFNIISN